MCAHDGHALVEIGAEVSEQMDVIPEQVRVLQHHRIKYACPCCDQSLKVAPTPARILPRGLLTEQAQAWVITGKYQFGMPLYRTAVLLRRFGGDIASNTLASGIVRIGQAVQTVINLLRDHLLDSDLIYGDETTVQVLKEPGRKAQTKSYHPKETLVSALAGGRQRGTQRNMSTSRWARICPSSARSRTAPVLGCAAPSWCPMSRKVVVVHPTYHLYLHCVWSLHHRRKYALAGWTGSSRVRSMPVAAETRVSWSAWGRREDVSSTSGTMICSRSGRGCTPA